VFALIGLFAGVWVAAMTSQWVAAQWLGARPALAFLVLRWLVACLAGLAVATLLQWCGNRFRDGVHAGPVAWLDRSVGVAVGAATAVIVATVVLLVAIVVPGPRTVSETAALARVAPPLMSGGARACQLAGIVMPGGRWLGLRFLAAERRTRQHDRSL
jgi:hypothetical protein